MNPRILQEIGLTEGETKVYMALLELGTTTTGPLIDKSGISASKAYRILDRLAKKGLVTYIIKEKTKYFKAADPNRILDYLDEKEKEIADKKQEIKKILPQLIQKQKETEKEQEATIYEGVKGVKTAHEKMLRDMKKGEEYYFLGGSVLSTEKFGSYWKSWHKRRAEKGIKGNLLFNRDVDKSELENRKKFGFCKAKYMPFDISTPAWIKVYKNITEIGVPTEKPLSVEIKSKDVAESFKAYFEALWEQDIRTYKGYEDFKKVWLETIEMGDTLYLIGAKGYYFDRRPEDTKEIVEASRKKGMKWKNIVDLETKGHAITKLDFAETRYFKEKITAPGVIWMCGDRLLISNWAKGDPILVVIDNKEICDSYKNYFKVLWGMAEG